MPVRVKCPTGHQLIVPDSRCGSVVVCPRCNQPVTVPPASRKSSLPNPVVLSQAAALQATKEIQSKAAISTTPIISPEPPPVAPASEPPKVKRPKRVISKPKEVLDALEAKPVGRLEPPPVPAAEKPPEPEPRLKVFSAPEPTTEPPPVEDVPSPPLVPVVEQSEPPAPAEPTSIQPPIVSPPAADDSRSAPLLEPSPIPAAELPLVELPPVEPAPIEPPPAKEAVPEIEPSIPSSEPIAESTPQVELPADDVAPAAESEPTTEPAADPAPIPLPPEPPPPPPIPLPKRAGLVHEPARLLVAWQVAGAIALTAIFSLCPALIEIVSHLRAEESPGISRWVWAVLLVGLVQIAYAIYIAQLPDWTSLWAGSLQSLAVAAGYAAVLGFVVTSRGDHWLLELLQLSDQLAGGRAALWCIAMIAAMSLLAYFSGFVSVRWHKAEMVMRSLAVHH